jgi:hypothetical protein
MGPSVQMPLPHGLLASMLAAGCLGAVASCVGVRQQGALSGAGGEGGVAVVGGGGAGLVSWSPIGGAPAPADPVDLDAGGRPMRCDDAGVCACMNIASFGKVAHYGGNSDSTDAFQRYLNTKSNARMTLLTERTTITAALLADYDVLILQALEDSEYNGFWSYAQSEVDALEAWVRAGNALIVLTGYGGDPREVDPANQLLAFAGISYGKSDTFVSCADNYCYCTDSSIPFTGWSPGTFIGVNMTAPLGGVGAVGLFHGRPVSCADTPDAPCQIVARDSQAGIVGVVKQLGQGRIFVWADEWVTYTSQWGAVNTHGADCNGHTAGEIFDVPQFWYNVIHWALPDASCFHISDPIIVE